VLARNAAASTPQRKHLINTDPDAS
jgi:hypothetical protein